MKKAISIEEHEWYPVYGVRYSENSRLKLEEEIVERYITEYNRFVREEAIFAKALQKAKENLFGK